MTEPPSANVDVVAFSERLRELMGEVANSPEELAVQLSLMLEELLVADEELHVQADELQVSRDAVDAARERYAELFDLLPDAVVETDPFGKIVDANRAAIQLLRRPLRFLMGKVLVSYVVADDRRTLRRLMRSDAAPRETVVRFRSHGTDTTVPAGVRTARRDGAVEGGLLWAIRDLSGALAMQRTIDRLGTTVEAYDRLVGLQRLVGEPDGLRGLTERIVAASAALFPAVVIVVQINAFDDVLASDPLGNELAALERADGHGPMGEATATGRLVSGGASGLVDRWPLGATAAEAGVVRVDAAPIVVDGEPVGAIAAWRFDELRAAEDLALLAVAADHLALAYANSNVLAAVQEHGANLERALVHRGVIEQAKGMLMQEYGLSANEAFERLRIRSQRTNRKLREVAVAVVARDLPIDDVH